MSCESSTALYSANLLYNYQSAIEGLIFLATFPFYMIQLKNKYHYKTRYTTMMMDTCISSNFPHQYAFSLVFTQKF